MLPVVVALGGAACGDDAKGSRTEVLGEQVVRATVSGVVRRAGVPVVGGQVTLGDRSVVTDAAGAFVVEGVAPGAYRLLAVDPGDDTPQCDASGACVSARSSAQAVVEVEVPDEGGVVPVDVDL